MSPAVHAILIDLDPAIAKALRSNKAVYLQDGNGAELPLNSTDRQNNSVIQVNLLWLGRCLDGNRTSSD